MLPTMDDVSAAVIANARGLAEWSAQAVVATDRLIERATTRPLSPTEQVENLRMQRELLVRISQRYSLLEWANEVRALQDAAKMAPPDAGGLRSFLRRLLRRS